MIDPATILPFIFSVTAIVGITLLTLSRGTRRVPLKAPPRVPSLDEMMRVCRYMTTLIIVALVVVGVVMFTPSFAAQQNPFVLIGCVLLVVGGLSLYVKVWMSIAGHSDA